MNVLFDRYGRPIPCIKSWEEDRKIYFQTEFDKTFWGKPYVAASAIFNDQKITLNQHKELNAGDTLVLHLDTNRQ